MRHLLPFLSGQDLLQDGKQYQLILLCLLTKQPLDALLRGIAQAIVRGWGITVEALSETGSQWQTKLAASSPGSRDKLGFENHTPCINNHRPT